MSTQGPDLFADDIMAAAVSETGLSDFGDEQLPDRLRLYVADAVENAKLGAAGAVALQGMIHRLLVSRLRFQADLRAHPEILDEDVSDPIVITGLFRTGTTKLQRMLSCDPGFQPLLFWKLLNPARFPGSAETERKERIAIAEAYSAQLEEHYPQFVAAHHWDAHDVDEEVLLFWMTFNHISNSCIGNLPRFSAAIYGADQTDNYRYVHSLLQYLQWQDGGRRERPWVLKSPVHIGQLPTLAKVFPNATIVRCHRDPLQMAASLARLMELFGGLFSDDVDCAQVGTRNLELWSEEANRPVTDPAHLAVPVLDVYYEDICAKPLQIIRSVYSARGLSLSDDIWARMEDWDKRNPQHAHGANPYSLERYGYTPESVLQAYDPYVRKFFP
jgi:hypothetical protein